MEFKKYIRIATLATIILCLTIILGLINQLHITNNKQFHRKSAENTSAYQIAITQTPIPLKITYIKPSGKEAPIQTYDNAIDVGNKIINDKLTEFFLLHREHNLLHPSDSISVRISEKGDKASVIINLPESAVMFDISLK